MADVVTALYPDIDTARVAAEDLIAAGLPANRVRVAGAEKIGTYQVEVDVRDPDEALNVRVFLGQDGAEKVGERFTGRFDSGSEFETPTQSSIPPVPFTP